MLAARWGQPRRSHEAAPTRTLSKWVLVRRVDIPIRQRNQKVKPPLQDPVRHRDAADTNALVGVLGHERPHQARAPVVADPDGLFALQVRQQRQHVADVLLQGVLGVVALGHAGPPVAPRIGGHGVEPQRTQGQQLGFPELAVGGPSVDEDYQGPGGWAGGLGGLG